MNFKTPFKVLTTAALLGTLTVSAVAPGAAASAKTTTASAKAEVAQDIKSVVLKKGDDSITLSYNDYASAQGSKALEGYVVTHVIADNGDVYDYETYGLAYSKGATTTEVFKKLADAEAPTTEVPAEAKEASFNEDGELVVSTPEEADFEVTEISAINATDANFTVKFGSDVTEADLKDVKINLEGPSELTASFVKLEGKTATFKVDQDILNKAAYNGDYKPAALGFKFADNAKTTYAATITDTTVEGFVTTDNVRGDAVGAANVKVKVGNKTVTTDENGYYKAAASAGLVDVVVEAGEGYFESEFKEQEVKRNFSTVVNAHTKAIVQDELAIDGKLVDAKTGDAIVGATVELQKEVDGEWVSLGKGVTKSSGRYVFVNDSAEAELKTSLDASNDTEIELATKFAHADKLRVVATKAVSYANLHNNYEEKVINVTTSKTGPATNLLDELRPIGEVKKFDLDLKWEDLTGTDNDADFTKNGAKVTLIGTDGKTKLTDAVNLTGIKAAGDKELTDALDLVAKNVFLNSGSDQKPNLPTGTYFLKVDDGANAIAYVPVKVTEATDASATATIEKARTLGTTTKFAGFTYDTALSVSEDANNLSTIDDSDAKGTAVKAGVNIYKNIEGVDVLVSTVGFDTDGKVDATDGKEFTVAYDTTAGAEKASATLEYAVSQLAKGDYKIEVASDYALTGKATGTAKVEAKAVNTANEIQVSPASTLEVEVLGKESGNPAVAQQDVKVELLDADNKVVGSYEDKTDNDGKIKLTGVKPGVVKVKVTPLGEASYKAGTASTTTTIKDIQDQKQQVQLEKIETPVVQGYVKYADDYANVEEGTVAVYSENGGLVAFYDLDHSTEGKYVFDSLKEGATYKFVVRGLGFETTSKTVKVTAGENDPLNFKVENGGKGQAKYVVTDKLNKTVSGVTAVAYDSLYKNVYGTGANAAAVGYYDSKKQFKTAVASNDTTDTSKSASAVTGPDFLGSYEFEQTGNVFKAENLSKDSYTVEVSDGETNYKDYGTTFTLANKNANYDGPAIQLELLSGELTSTITGTATTTAGNNDDIIDYVVVFDKDGKFVKRSENLADPSGTPATNFDIEVPNGATYTLAYYANGAFVGSKQVTVQDYDVTGVTLTGDKAER